MKKSTLVSIVRTALLALFCLVQVVTLEAENTIEETPWYPHFLKQFEKLQEWNKACIEEGRQDETIYLLTYTPFETLEFNVGACDSDTWWTFKEGGAPNHVQQSITEAFCEDVKCRLKGFNETNAGGSCTGVITDNPDNVKIYAVYVNYWGYYKADAAGLANSNSVVEYLSNKKAYDYSEYTEDSRSQYSSFKFGHNSQNNLLIFYSDYFVYNGTEQTKKGVYYLGSKSSGSLLRDNRDCRKIKEEAQYAERTYPGLPTAFTGIKKFYNRILSSIEFLAEDSNSEECEDCGADILELISSI